ncbi:conserved hypothetical protein [Gammaproteobacteria bacterium]
MAIDIGKKEIKVSVTFGGNETVFTCRVPDNQERIAYHGGLLRKGKVDAEHIYRHQVKSGLSVVTRVRAGDILFCGKPLVIDADGKKVLEENAPELLSALGRAIFEGGAARIEDEDADYPL